MFRLISSMALCVILVAAAAQDPPVLEFREIASPAGAGSAMPQLMAIPHDPNARDAALLLSWLERTDRQHYRFRWSQYSSSAWSTPRTIVEGENLFANWADVPAVYGLDDGRLAAHWLERTGTGKYAYGVRVAVSSADRQTWSRPATPHRDRTATEHGFVSWWATPAGKRSPSTGLIWLDGRDLAGHGGVSHDEGMKAEMALRAATIDDNGRPGPEMLIDPRVCDCCPTAAARTAKGILVAYRDRSREEIRDITLARYSGGTWTKPYSVHRDNWRIPGCPVNGPALAANGDRVVLTWFTVPNGTAQVLAAFSTDAGITFSKPVRVDDGVPIGRLDVEIVDSGAAAVSWIEHNGGAPQLRVRRITAEAAGPMLTVSRIAGDRSSGYPRIARLGDDLFAAWTDTATPSRVKVAVLRGFARTALPGRPRSTR